MCILSWATGTVFHFIGCAIDLVFVLDDSGSISSTEFQTVRELTVKIAETLDIGIQESLVGVIIYDSVAKISFNLLEHPLAETLLPALNSLPYSGGGSTVAASGINLLLASAQDGTMGIRDGHHHVAVFVNDGDIIDSNDVAAAEALHAAGIFEVYAIGLPGTNLNYLNHIASDPSLVFSINEFDDEEFLAYFNQLICQQQS